MAKGEATIAAPNEGESLKHKLLDIFAERKIVAAGSVQLLGLADLREKIGGRWDAVAEKVHMLVERLLRNTLSPQDAWFRFGEEDYIVVFAKLTRSAAQLICGKLAEQLHQQLLGGSATKDIYVRTVVFDVNGDLAVESARLPELLRAAITPALGQVRDEDSMRSHGQGKDPHRPRETSDFLDFASAQPSERREKRLDALRAAVNRNFPDQPSQVVFRPIWDAKHQVFSTYRCIAARSSDRYNNIAGYDLLANPDDFDAVFDLDCDTLTKTVIIASELYTNNFRYFSCISVHFETLASPKSRMEYVDLLKVIPRHLSQFIDFLVHGLPTGVPLGRIIELNTLLRNHCRAMIPIVDIGDRNLAAYSQASLKLIGARIPLSLGDGEAEERIRSFAMATRKCGLITYVGGIRTPIMFDAACKSGISYMSGPFFGPDSEYPQHMRRCGKTEILALADHGY